MKTKIGLAVAGLAATALAQSSLFGSGGAPSTIGAQPAQVAASTFTETFTGAPGAPTPWAPTNWDVVVHSRDRDTFDQLEPMQAYHGPDCAGPPARHTTSSYEGAVFQCRDHMMTAISASGYGAIYLTPAAMVDFSGGEAVIRVDVSTLQSSARDWWDIWITPFEENLLYPLESWLPDLQGPPRNAIQIRQDQGIFRAFLYRNGVQSGEITTSRNTREVLTPDAARRDTFELRLSRTHVSFGLPAYGLSFLDGSFADLGWSQGVVQFGHHSYNPFKDPGGEAGTWHWDNVSISPAVPFTMIKAQQRTFSATDGSTAVFAAPAPANARLRFGAIGANIQVSFDGGGSWQAARKQPQSDIGDHFSSYWMPIPAGATSATFAGSDWFGGAYRVRDVAVWAASGSTPALPGPGAPPIQPAQGDPASSGRLLDTRPGASTVDGQFLGQGRIDTGGTIELQVAGRATVPATAGAVTLNLTSTDSLGTGYVTAYPCGQPRPATSNLNFSAGDTMANAVVTAVGAGGKVCLFAGGGGSTHLVVDVSATLGANAGFSATAGSRLLDGRPGTSTIDNRSVGIGRSSAGSVMQLQVAGRGGVPSNASTVLLNLTATGADGTGYVTAWPCGQSMPIASNLNFGVGRTTANSVIVQVGAGGKVCLYTGAASAYLIADVGGTFAGNAGYHAMQPARLLDTRAGASTVDGAGLGAGQRPAWTEVQVQVAGRSGVPQGVGAVVLNITSTLADGMGYVTVYPCNEGRPLTSTLNPTRNRDLANMVTTKLDSSGKVCLYVAATASHVVVDVNGWFDAGTITN